ncbi:MAG: hypothetical protein OSJ62_06580 [Lachnospiraceae bacterium]|nr:hypothetical protein [Lachnospiraceae bacterium]
MEQIEYIIGDENKLRQMPEIRAWKPFDKRVINFCSELSETLMKEKNYLFYPDLVTLAFWLRKSNIQKICKKYCDMTDYLGRGLAFHIAPGNVALSFAYSLATGLLTGNTNIIRLPSRNYEQVDIFCEALQKVLAKEPELAKRLCLLKYPHNKAITDELSSKCHIRIIWGGDNTINVIRQSPLPPRATEVTFANRFSVCLIDADQYLSDYDPKKTAHDFYIDTYLSDQNACSSPRILFWLGKKVIEAKKIFWDALHNEIDKYNIASVTTVNKLLTFCKFAAENKCQLITEIDYKIMRIKIESLNQTILNNIGNSGFFYEYDVSNISEILPICTWELQTLSYIGFNGDSLRELILSNAPDGIDRIVPVGHTMNFGFVWDGRDIVRDMTRKISMT